MISRMAEPIARSCIVPKFDYRVITVVDVAVVRCDENVISNRYLNFVCNSKYFMNAAVSKARGSTRLRITRSHLAQIPIPLPPIDEQHKIVARLNELLPLCEALEKIT